MALSILTLPAAHADNGVNFDLKGFATGQTVHASLLETGQPPLNRIADAEVAWAGATVDATADGLKTGKLNEMNRIFQPGLVGKHTQARGSGLEIGLGTTPSDPNQIILAAKSEANAPPSSSDTHDLLGPLSVPPLAYASALASNAVANWNASPLVPGVCVVGNDLSRGHGYAANVQLLDAGTTQANGQLGAPVLQTSDTITPDPQRNVSQTTTRERLVPNGQPNGFGLMSEVRETIAPVTVLADNTNPSSPRQVTIEVLGEWVLRTVAKGTSGGATVFYGPGQASPDTPILRIIDSKNAVSEVLKTQDLFGPGKLPVPLINIPNVLQVTIGENPRAIAPPGQPPVVGSKPTTAGDGSLASAAVDVARVLLLNQPVPSAADIRLGHMEASAQVPANGISCPIPVTKAANPSSIQVDPGSPDTSRVTITVHNVYDCDLTSTVLTDTITQKESDPDFKLVASNPDPSSVEGDGKSATLPTDNIRSAKVTWDLGTVPRGGTKSVTLDIKSATRGGVIRDVANAAGTFKNCVGSAAIGLDVANLNLTGLSPIVEVAIETPRTGPSASRTTAAGAAIALVATSLALVARRRRTA